MYFLRYLKFKTLLFPALVLPLLAGCKPRGANSSLADGGGQGPITQEEAYQFFASNVPLLYGQQDFFAEAEKNGSLRQQYNSLISSNPELAKLVQEGLAYRKEYSDLLDKDFSQDIHPFVVDPDGEVLRRLSLYIQLNETKTVDMPIPPHKARMLALQDTQQRFGLPVGWDDNRIMQNDYDAYMYLRRRIVYYELQDERQKKPTFPNIETWKRSIIRTLNKARGANLSSSLLRTAKEHSFPLQLHYKPNNKWFEITQNELADAEFIFEGSPPENPQLFFKGRSIPILNYTPADNGEGLVDAFGSLWHLSMFRAKDKQEGDFARALYSIPNSAQQNPDKPVGIRISKTVADAEMEEFLSEHNRMIVLPAKELLYVIKKLRVPFSQEPSARAETLYRYVVEASKREAMLEGMIAFLEEKEDQNFEALRSRLTARALEISKDEKSAYKSISKIIQKDGLKIPPSDQVEGIKWRGYRDHPQYWQLRSSIAESSGAPRYDEPVQKRTETKNKMGIMRRFRLAYSNHFAKSSTFVRGTVGAMFLATYFFIGANTVPPTVKAVVSGVEAVIASASTQSPNRVPRFDQYQLTNHPRGSLDEYSKSLYDSRQKEALYNIEALSISADEIPQYFSVLQLHQNDRPKTHDHPLKTNDSNADFKVSTLPAGLETDGKDFPIPSPKGCRMSALKLRNADSGETLQINKDYAIFVSEDKIYSVVLTKYPQNISAEAYFRKDPDLESKYVDRELRDRKTLTTINDKLRKSGFTKIADAMDQKIKKGPIMMSDVANVIGSESFYTYSPELEKPKNSADNFLEDLTRFEKDGCLYGQCTAGNELLHKYLTLYEIYTRVNSQGEYDGDYKLSRQVGFYRSQDSMLFTGGDGHRFTRVYLDDGLMVHLDGTPRKEDPETIKQRNKIEQERKALEEKIKKENSQSEGSQNEEGTISKYMRQIKESVSSKLNYWFGSDTKQQNIENQNNDNGKNSEKNKSHLPNDPQLKDYQTMVTFYFRREKTFAEIIQDDPNFDKEIDDFQESVKKQLQGMYLFKKQIIDSKDIQNLPSTLRQQLPITRSFKLMEVLQELRLGRLQYKSAIEQIRKLFPGTEVDTSIPQRAQVTKMLDSIYEDQIKIFANIQNRVLKEGASVRFSEFADPKVSDPMLELLGYMRSNDWSPAISAFLRQTGGCVAVFDKLQNLRLDLLKK